MKKILTIVSLVVFISVALLGVIRFVIGGSEDDWICVDGQWVKHGAPRAPKPEGGCGEERSEDKPIGGERDEHGCLGPAGYTWCEVKQKCLREWEEPCEQEEVFDLLRELKDFTSISFSGINEVEFDWHTEGEKADKVTGTKTLTLIGKGVDAVEVSDEKLLEIKNFFEDQGFVVDMYNVAAGTIVGATGYQKESLVCLVIEGLSGLDREDTRVIPTLTGESDVEIKCGELD